MNQNNNPVPAENIRKMTDAMQRIFKSVQCSGLSDESMAAVKDDLAYFGGAMNTTDVQSALLSTLLALGGCKSVGTDHMAAVLGLNRFSMLRLNPAMEELVAGKYIVECPEIKVGLFYRLSDTFMKALQIGKYPEPIVDYHEAAGQLYDNLEGMFIDYEHCAQTAQEVVEEFEDLLKEYADNFYAQRLAELSLSTLSEQDRFAAYYILWEAEEYGRESFPLNYLFRYLERDPQADFSALIATGLVELQPGQKDPGEQELVLTDHVRTYTLKGAFDRYMNSYDIDEKSID